MPVCNETEFKKRLTNMQLPRIAFIFGEEKFLVHHYTDKLSEKAVGKHPSEFNFHTFDSKSTIDEIAQAALAVPFMADLLLIKVLDLDVESLSDNQYKKFQELLTIVPSSTVLVFSWPTFDIGNKKSAKWKKLVEAVSKTEDGVVF
ncbi:MAG: hypothetical protein Q8876_04210 [Bacillota bacterium]|nr:hypothetical protein [Bacillota bacterium]